MYKKKVTYVCLAQLVVFIYIHFGNRRGGISIKGRQSVTLFLPL